MSTLEPRPQTPAYGTAVAADRDRARAVFANVMFLVSVSVGFTALGAWVGRDLSGGAALAFTIAGIVGILGLGLARRSTSLGMTVLFGVGLLLGLGLGPLLSAYASVQGGSTILSQAAGSTALFVGAFGSYGYATRRDLSSWGRTLFWLLLGLIAVGFVTIFVQIPGGRLIYAILGLLLFAALTMFDFNRLRRANPDDAVWIAASIYLDVLNVFLFFLQILGGSRN